MQSADSVVNRQQGELERKILILPEERKKAEGEKKKKPGDDLLSHGQSRSTIGEEAFHGRVRDGNV